MRTSVESVALRDARALQQYFIYPLRNVINLKKIVYTSGVTRFIESFDLKFISGFFVDSYLARNKFRSERLDKSSHSRGIYNFLLS